jgi:hypothetical protein
MLCADKVALVAGGAGQAMGRSIALTLAAKRAASCPTLRRANGPARAPGDHDAVVPRLTTLRMDGTGLFGVVLDGRQALEVRGDRRRIFLG